MTGEPPLDFFYDAGSCSLAVRIVLEEGGFAYRAQPVSARGREAEVSQPAWRARNPKGRVPALSPVAVASCCLFLAAMASRAVQRRRRGV